jgi:hypothetical protein
LLEKYGRNPKFTLIERASLDRVYDELALTEKVGFPVEAQLKVGRLSNATHLFIVDVTRFESGPDILDIYASKIIEVESGRLLASQSRQFIYRPR